MKKVLVGVLALAAIVAVVAAQSNVSFNYNVDPNSVSVTGFSSGAYFAVQYQFAHSASITGAAIFAGGPYYCAQDQMVNAMVACMSQAELIDVQTLVQDVKTFAGQGSIDDISNLAKHKIFVFSGDLDTVVDPPVVKKLVDMYTTLNVPKENLLTNFNLGDEHGFPTTSYGNQCSYQGTPWINNCGYDGAGTALQQIYGSLKTPVPPVPSNIMKMPQAKFTPNDANPGSLSLGNTLYYYMPTACQSGSTQCRLHIVFHGCQQYVDVLGTVFVENAGFNGWAEANNIIVVYPQTVQSMPSPLNPEGCWDWWGYNEQAYATQQGSQIQFVNNIVNYFLKNN